MNSTFNKLAIEIGELQGPGTLGNTSGDEAPTQFANIISTSIAVLTIVAAIWFLFILITGAIGVMSAGGDKGQYESSRKKITTGVVGLIIVVAAIFLFQIVALVLGIPDILNVDQIITDLSGNPPTS